MCSPPPPSNKPVNLSQLILSAPASRATNGVITSVSLMRPVVAATHAPSPKTQLICVFQKPQVFGQFLPSLHGQLTDCAIVCFVSKDVSIPICWLLFFLLTVSVEGSFTMTGLDFRDCLADEMSQGFQNCNKQFLDEVKTSIYEQSAYYLLHSVQGSGII